MPKRTDIKKILIIGAGPIIIGQACEFDYSGTQACKALKEDGFEIVLINSNPATIMTDPEMADRTYIEPITVEIVAKIIAKERPQAILPTLGGQTGLNMAMDLAKQGVLKKFNVEMIGANEESIEKAENRKLFKACIQKIGLDLPKSGYATSVEEAKAVAKDIGAFPLILRPSFTLGGTGGGVAESYDEYLEMVQIALDASPVREVLIEESIIGWKEYELEVMRDKADNVVIICSIENFDPMGVHTGDSITVAPQQTLSDKEYQLMRDAAIQIIREIGVETGGSNIQFGVNPTNGRMVVIEMNPRVSRSSALASKATGFPIAKIAAKLAVGYTLNELTNDITKETPASFEPTIDYCVVKLPRFTFEKFPGANTTLTTKMKSVGETMSIGRTFKEAFQKAIRSLETGYYGFGSGKKVNDANLIDLLKRPNANRLQALYQALQKKMTIEELYKLTYIDPWFLNQMKDLVELDKAIENFSLTKKIQDLSRDELHWIKSNGISDRKLAELFKMNEVDVRKYRVSQKVEPGFRLVDTCAAEFEAYTPYYYSSYDVEDESRPNTKKKIYHDFRWWTKPNWPRY